MSLSLTNGNTEKTTLSLQSDEFSRMLFLVEYLFSLEFLSLLLFRIEVSGWKLVSIVLLEEFADFFSGTATNFGASGAGWVRSKHFAAACKY